MTEIEVNENIEKALGEIRPFLNSDGGDIELVEVVDGKHVKVRLKAGVEKKIKKYVPQIETVENVG